jgi:hypothetical protein
MPFEGPSHSTWTTPPNQSWPLPFVLCALLLSSLAAAGQSCCTGSGGCCANESQCYQDGSGQVCDLCSCTCQPGNSPIIVDTTGRGFHLTSAEAGVTFDIQGTGQPFQIAWTVAGSGNAFLALDRDGNGKIDNGKELFGNYTKQPNPDHPNGYLALAEFDEPENGGNGDGIIDSRDAIFPSLLLWVDENHDGISQPNELYSLPELGVYSIGLHYRDDRSLYDQFGNWFHYQSLLNPDRADGQSRDGRMTYDVFFVADYNHPPRDAKAHPLLRKDWLSADLLLGIPGKACHRR